MDAPKNRQKSIKCFFTPKQKEPKNVKCKHCSKHISHLKIEWHRDFDCVNYKKIIPKNKKKIRKCTAKSDKIEIIEINSDSENSNDDNIDKIERSLSERNITPDLIACLEVEMLSPQKNCSSTNVGNDSKIISAAKNLELNTKSVENDSKTITAAPDHIQNIEFNKKYIDIKDTANATIPSNQAQNPDMKMKNVKINGLENKILDNGKCVKLDKKLKNNLKNKSENYSKGNKKILKDIGNTKTKTSSKKLSILNVNSINESYSSILESEKVDLITDEKINPVVSLLEDWTSPDSSPVKMHIETPQYIDKLKKIEESIKNKPVIEDNGDKLNLSEDYSTQNIQSEIFKSDKDIELDKVQTPNKNCKENELKTPVKVEIEGENSCMSYMTDEDYYNNCGIVTPIRTPSPSPSKFTPNSESYNSVKLNCISKPLFSCGKNLEPSTPSCKIESQPSPFNSKPTFLTPQTKGSLKSSVKRSLSLSPQLKSSPNKFKICNVRNLLESNCDTPKAKRKIISPVKSVPFSPKSSPSKNTSADTETNLKISYRTTNGIYLDSFLKIVDIVMSQPDDLALFNEKDLNIIKDFHGLSLQAKKLYVRLFLRKTKWNRVCKLDYNEICDIDDISLYVNELTYADYLYSEEKIVDLKEMLCLLDGAEIKELCKEMKLQASGSKSDMISRLCNFEKSQKSIVSFFKKSSPPSCDKSFLIKLTKKIVGKCYIINKEVSETFMRILFIYSPIIFEDEDSGQPPQLKNLLLVSIGRTKFPNCTVIRHHSIFYSRDDVMRFQKCLQLYYDIQDLIDKQEWVDAITSCLLTREIRLEIEKDKKLYKHATSLPTFLRRFTTMALLFYIEFKAVECYQRLKRYSEAVVSLETLLGQNCYCLCSRGKFYDRLTVNLLHLKQEEKCLQILEEALTDSEVRVGYRLALSKKAERLLKNKKWADWKDRLNLMNHVDAPKIVIKGKCLPGDSGAGYRRMFINSDEISVGIQFCSVEELTLNYYREQGFPQGIHGEGLVIQGIFGFLLWDAIYAPIPDAFRSPHQKVPFDLDSPHFYEARRDIIEKRLEEITNWSEAESNEAIKDIWENHLNTISVIEWKIFSSYPFVQGLVSSLGLGLVVAICRRLAMDHRFTRSGFPDLIVWNPDRKASVIVEVKGPNDKLSSKQILWLDYLLRNGADAQVCHVQAVGLRSTNVQNPDLSEFEIDAYSEFSDNENNSHLNEINSGSNSRNGANNSENRNRTNATNSRSNGRNGANNSENRNRNSATNSRSNGRNSANKSSNGRNCKNNSENRNGTSATNSRSNGRNSANKSSNGRNNANDSESNDRNSANDSGSNGGNSGSNSINCENNSGNRINCKENSRISDVNLVPVARGINANEKNCIIKGNCDKDSDSANSDKNNTNCKRKSKKRSSENVSSETITKQRLKSSISPEMDKKYSEITKLDERSSKSGLKTPKNDNKEDQNYSSGEEFDMMNSSFGSNHGSFSKN